MGSSPPETFPLTIGNLYETEVEVEVVVELNEELLFATPQITSWPQ
jgi:hypothetical protein